MFKGQRLVVAAVTALLVAGLGACGSGGHDAPGHHGAGANAHPVFGLRDIVRHVPRRTVQDTRPHMVRQCTSATKRVRHTKRTGTRAHRKTRTWYTTERYRRCRRVRKGTETYRRVVQQERWCVRLNRVRGDATRNGVWYRVTRGTYDKALGTEHDVRIEFVPVGTGC